MVDTGYIYLTLDEFYAGRLVHLMSGVDQECHLGSCTGAMVTAITGYTEWVSAAAPVLTIGWDWQMIAEENVVRLERVGPPSSNVMLLSPGRRELGHAGTVALLNGYLDGFDWQAATLAHIGARQG
jgi:hypothetical protein